MTIDEAIAKLRSDTVTDKYNMCGYSMEQHKQIAEWLEELKSYRASVFSGDMTQSMLKEERNKAIDDLREKLIQNGFISTEYALVIFDEIAEQLKAGK